MNKEKINKISEGIKKGIKTAGVMAKGIIYFLILVFVVWSSLNLDVLIKTIRYPEAIRALKINIAVEQLSK